MLSGAGELAGLAQVEWQSCSGVDVSSVEERRASWLELFFDLVLVAAVAALAGQLHRDHSVVGLAVFAGLFVPCGGRGGDSRGIQPRLTTMTRSIASRCSRAWPALRRWRRAFRTPGESDSFVVAYAGLFGLLAALYRHAWKRFPVARRLSLRYTAGYALGAALWLASLGFSEGIRPLIWGVAMVVFMGSPVLAAASQDVFSYDAGHIAERYGLFTLIVLGESVVVTVAGLDTRSSLAAVLVALLGLIVAAGMWWLYFDRWRGMPAGGLRSGWVWAQGHLLVFAGIAAAAVGVEFAVEAAAHGRDLELADRLPLCAGVAAYLAAMAVIRAATRRPDWIVSLRAAAAALALAEAVAPLVLVAAVPSRRSHKPRRRCPPKRPSISPGGTPLGDAVRAPAARVTHTVAVNATVPA